MNIQGLGYNLSIFWGSEDCAAAGPCDFEWPKLHRVMMSSMPRLVSKDVSGFMVIPEQGSELIPMASVISKGCMDSGVQSVT